MELSNIGSPAKIIYSSMYTISDSSTGDIVFTFDTIEEVSFKASSNVTSYPTETGIKVTDYKYDNPDQITVRGIINRNSYIGKNHIDSALAKVETIEKVRTELERYKKGIYKLDIQTKAGLRQGYTLDGFEIPESADNYSLFEVEMSFTQVVSFQSINPKSNSDSDTVNIGTTQTREVE